MTLSSFLSSLVGPLHADAPEESKVEEAEPQEEAAAVEEEEDPEDVRSLYCHRGRPSLNMAHADSPPDARTSAGDVQVQSCHAALRPLPGESPVGQGLQA